MPRKATKSKRKKAEKGLITVYLPVSLIDQVKNIVYWTSGLTIASFAVTAIGDSVDVMEGERGEVFPKR